MAVSYKTRNLEGDGEVASWISSIGGISPSKHLSTVNTSLETVLNRIETCFCIEKLEGDIRSLCIEVNRLLEHIETNRLYCSSSTCLGILTTLARLRAAVERVRRCANQREREPPYRSYCALKTPQIPEDLVLLGAA